MSELPGLSAPLEPGATIGILGGGQLGRMLALAAARLGFKCAIFSDRDDTPAFDVACTHTRAAYDDEVALRSFAGACDLVTFEFENIPAAAATRVAEHVPFAPGVRALALTQDRLEEKKLVSSLGLKTPKFFPVAAPAAARMAFAGIDGPAVMKTRRFGYDGKGQVKIASAAEAERAYEKLNAPSILEAFVDFAFEASVIAARGADGGFAVYDPPRNMHEHHILRRSTVPSPLTPDQVEDAKDIARRIGEALDYVGVFAVELFVARDGELLINEIAPRVHNSGHWTLEACATSQFEQHIRAIAGWPLGPVERHSNVEMENVLGFEAADYLKLAARGSLHLYGKSEMRQGRKMGHLTMLKPKSE
jgi:5-(carboxyamino)imidazole ribonucleotide synthase